MSRHAYQLFDNITNPTILTAFLHPAKSSLFQAQQAHAHLLKTGNSTHSHLVSNLLSLYANHHSFPAATLLLNSLPHPTISSFSTLIYASSKQCLFDKTLHFFSLMLSQGLLPDNHLIPTAIKACSGLYAIKPGKQIHGFVVTSGFGFDSFIQSSLIHMYVKVGLLSDAHELFDKMPEPDVVACSALVAGYARKGFVKEAKMVFCKMKELGIERNLVTWNGIIAGFNQSGHSLEAMLMFKEMHLVGFMADGTTVSSVVSSIGDLESFKVGVQIHGYVIKLGLGIDKCVMSSLIDMYGKCAYTAEMCQVLDEVDEFDLGSCNALVTGLARNSLTEEALRVFKKFQRQGLELNVVSWTSIIACCSQHGKDIEALELFREMQIAGVKPNAVTIPCLLPACGNIAALMHGKAAHCFSLRKGFSNDVYVGSALVDMYANCGKIHSARVCFNSMPNRNLVSWNAMLGGYAMHGMVKEVMEIFDLMKRSDQKPDFITFTSLLSACSQSGLTEEGQRYFNSMSKEYGIEARVEHYACMVTLLGRAGKLEEAYSIIKEMPFEPDACVWGALLSSCRVHHNMSLAEVASHKLFELEPTNPGNYILLSNIYASKGKWKEVDRVRDLMKSKGLKKHPGISWVEIKNKVHMLLAGDESHPQMAQIMEKLDELSFKLKKSGHFPVTSFVLQDVEDQEKEHILCGHSEKLAVVLGLLNTPAGSSLRVIKNLRICGDCHVFMKFISSFEGREISVRDTNRFHHFKDGSCSCGDYW